ncbi:uncharacterized protein LACBIDRAFT_310303 [Laccaria bicolor S238N-H82]|uniref:Predicted protein n=1 Tax=Laccaria bicolor (strain S238N-H82 / ATCC MYA-4686) TaxID=486041 RepID=B0DU30_LACBS|nr:uncharacterized protein LACBIDRAFT_310303 [Laccaria bicolor S238N-H82]EDR01831.1 predicted protein [Laccaria bicolor S238N-H82]|eukprot:XP_001887441.1 predicted protein [Laccaria bicolor S238N-H82]
MTFNPLLQRVRSSIVWRWHRESPVSRNVRARTHVLQNSSGKGRRTFHEPRHLQSMLAFREMPMPTRLILSRSTFFVLRRGSLSCHVPETRLVVRFRCLGGTGTEQPHNTFNRFALKVLAPIWISTQHDPTRTLFFLGLVVHPYWVKLLVNMLKKASAHFGQNECWHLEHRLLALQ